MDGMEATDKTRTRMKLWTAIACVGVVALSAADAAETCVANCTEIYKPVCGSDGKTYENQCAFDYKKCSTKNETLKVVAEGECPAGASSAGSSAGGVVGSNCAKGCPKIMMPVCGSDGKTYSNECELNNAKCTNSKLTLAAKGECGSSAGSAGADECGKTMCPMDYAPVCGSDGVTYSNECKLKVEQCSNPSLTQVSTGECGPTSKMGSVAGEASAGGSQADSSAVSSTPSVPTPAPTTSAAGAVVSMQLAASVLVAAVASALL